jgi:hypothetical protein
MRAVFLMALAAALLSAVAATASPVRVEHLDTTCDVPLKALRTLTDPQRNLVNLRPTDTTVGAINALAQPHPTPRARSTDFSRRVWRVVAQITEFRLAGDRAIQLVLFDAGTYLVAAMPDSHCLSRKTRNRQAIIAVRKKFEASCGQATKNWKALGAVAMISGVGFFDIPQTQKPQATNFAELNPVTGIRFLSGCGA